MVIRAINIIKKHKLLAILTVVCALTVIAGLQTAKYLEKLAMEKMPEAKEIYEIEQKYFPDYKVSALKTFYPQSASGPHYTVVLDGNSIPSDYEYIAAGRLACGTSIDPSSIVTVTGRKQFWPLPFYVGKSISGSCPQKS